MRHAWNLPPQPEHPGEVARRVVDEVLLEYDGPQLVVLLDSGARYLGLAVDDDPLWVRWIHAPISRLELEGLKRQGEAIRDAFVKPEVTVVDYSRGDDTPMGAWRVPFSGIPETALPKRGVLLPADEEIPEPDALEAPCFRFFGPAIKIMDAVTFGQLSALTGKIQGLWNAVSQEEFKAGPAILYATAPATGSMKILVHTDNLPLYERVARRYRELVLASDDAEALKQTLEGAPRGVTASYEEYLQAVSNQGVEVLAQWREGTAFVGHGTAERVRQSLPTDEAPVEAPTSEPEERHFRGFFENFWRARRWAFEFYDLDGRGAFEGRIDPVLRPRLRDDPNFQVILGHSDREYRILVRIGHTNPPTYSLLDFEIAP